MATNRGEKQSPSLVVAKGSRDIVCYRLWKISYLLFGKSILVTIVLVRNRPTTCQSMGRIYDGFHLRHIIG